MQVAYKLYSWIKNHNRFAKIAAFLLKISILFFSIFYIYRVFSSNDAFLQELGMVFGAAFSGYKLLYLLALLLMLFVNWGLEAKKWQLLTKPVSPLGFWEAYRSVISGLLLSSFASFLVGQHLGRVWQIKHPKRHSLLGATFLNSYNQLYFTFLCGSIAWLYLLFDKDLLAEQWFWPLSLVDLLVCVLGLCCLLFPKVLTKFLFGKWQKLYYFFSSIECYSSKDLKILLLLSFLRYLVFCLQYLLVLEICGIAAFNLLHLLLVSCVFLGKSLLPTFSQFSSLGTREAVALYVFGFYQVPATAVFCSSVGLWVVNLLIPIVLAWFFLPNMRLIKPKSFEEAEGH